MNRKTDEPGYSTLHTVGEPALAGRLQSFLSKAEF